MDDLWIFDDIKVYDAFCDYLKASTETYLAIADGKDEKEINSLQNNMYRLENNFRTLEGACLNGTHLDIDKYLNLIRDNEQKKYVRIAALYAEMVQAIQKSYQQLVATNFN